MGCVSHAGFYHGTGPQTLVLASVFSGVIVTERVGATPSGVVCDVIRRAGGDFQEPQRMQAVLRLR